MNALQWLLRSDPAIVWQTMRDLTDEDANTIAAVRSRIHGEGWGKLVLEAQSPRGQWGARNDAGWMRTVHHLSLLKDLGVDPTAAKVRRAIERVRKHVTWYQLDGRPYFDGETEPCINGRILGCGAYFGRPSESLLNRLLREQLADGGWNCEAPKSACASFHSTICVLEGLLAYEEALGPTRQITQAREKAQQYLLKRRMFRSLRTGEIVDRSWTRFSYPPSYRYDILRGLDYLRSAHVDADQRVAEAVEVVKKRRHQNGLWPLNRVDPRHFTPDMDLGLGRRSYWNTLRALRVLKWFDRKEVPT